MTPAGQAQSPPDGAQFEEQAFVERDWSSRILSGVDFEDCVFRHCSLSAASLPKCRFLGARFENCDLGLVKPAGSRWRDAAFMGCKLIGVDWRGAGSLVGLSFERCVLDYCLFSGLNLRGVRLLDCSAREADFSACDLREAACRGTDFQAARFDGTDLRKADLRGARNYDIDPLTNKLRKARVCFPEAMILLRGLDVLVEEPPDGCEA